MSDTSDDKATPRERVASILVSVPVDWLTNDGEDSEEAGWTEVKGQIEPHLGRYNAHGSAAAMPTLSFIEWREDL